MVAERASSATPRSAASSSPGARAPARASVTLGDPVSSFPDGEETDSEPERARGVDLFDQALVGGAEVVQLPFEGVRPFGRSRPRMAVRGSANAKNHPAWASRSGGHRRSLESFRRELTDRLEHPESRLGSSSLLRTRLFSSSDWSSSKSAPADRLRRSQRVGPPEDGESTEEPLLVGVSSSYDQAIVARSVRCRGSASRARFSMSSRWPSRSSSCAGVKSRPPRRRARSRAGADRAA